jgi:hypothetical protein
MDRGEIIREGSGSTFVQLSHKNLPNQPSQFETIKIAIKKAAQRADLGSALFISPIQGAAP